MEYKKANDEICKKGVLVFVIGALINIIGGYVCMLPFQVLSAFIFIEIIIFVIITSKLQGDIEVLRNRTIYMSTTVVKFLMIVTFIFENNLWEHEQSAANDRYMYFLCVPFVIVQLIEVRVLKKDYGSKRYRKYVMLWSVLAYACTIMGNNSFWGLIMLIPILTAFTHCEDIKLITIGCAISNLVVICGGLTQTQYYDTNKYASIFDIPKLLDKIFKGTLKDSSKYMLYIYLFIVAFLVVYSLAIINVIKCSNKFNDEKINVIKNEQENIEKLINKIFETGMKIKTNTFETDTMVNKLSDAAMKSDEMLNTVSKQIFNNKDRISKQSIMADNITKLIYEVEEDVNITIHRANMALEELDSNKRNINELKENASKIYKNNEIINLVIDEFVSSVNEVKSITNGIDYILDETNLLSFNTSIKSAKAKESGRSFFVIAKEIRKLANETNSFTNNINEIVSKLESSALVTQTATSEIINAINQENQTIDETIREFEKMNVNIQKLSSNVDEIYNSVGSVANYNSEIKKHIEKLDLSSDEVINDTQSVIDYNRNNKEMIIRTKENMKEMLVKSDKLEELCYKSTMS